MNKNLKVNYLARDFSSIKQELKNYASRYYSDTLSDLSEASLNSFLIESVAYVGDVLSYFLDYQTNETFLSNALEYDNILNLAKSLGYKNRDRTSACGKLAMYILIPSDDSGEPNFSKTPTIKKGSEFSTPDEYIYTSTEDVKVEKRLIGKNYVVAQTNAQGNPTYFAVKIYIPVVSGRVYETNIRVENFIKFNKIFLDNLLTTEIISVIDSDGNEYYEVPNLSQNIIYKSYFSPETFPNNSIKAISAYRRFVFDSESNRPYLLFGGKQYKEDDDVTINPIVEPNKFILNRYNNDYLENEYFDPNVLLNGDTYGIGPDNTTLTIKYRANNSGNNNANVGKITNVENLLVSFETNSAVTEIEKNQILSSVQVVNEEPIIGENNIISINDIKDISGQIFNSQNRAVTAKDYEALTYLMPQKYGFIKRVKAYRDPTSLKNNINLYVVCVDENNHLVRPNIKIKENLKTWLSGYKIITDSVDIIDAKIINLGIDFTVKIDPSANKSDVLSLVKQQLRYVYSFKPLIGESFSILDIYREIRKIDKVLDVINVKITNKVGDGYSQTFFNVKQNITSDGNFVKIPKNAIYEIKYLSETNSDIIGNAL